MWQLFVVQAYICMLLVYWLQSSIKQLTGRNRRFHSSHKKNFEIVLVHVRYSAILPFTVLYIVRRADGKYRPWEPGSSRSEVYWCCERWSAKTAHNTRVLGTEDNNDQSAFSHCSWAADYDGGNGRNGGGLKRGVKCHKGYLVGGRERAETLWHRQTLTIENNRATVGTTVVAVERWWVEGVKPTCQLLLENKRTVCTWCISVFSSFTLEGRCVGNREEGGGGGASTHQPMLRKNFNCEDNHLRARRRGTVTSHNISSVHWHSLFSLQARSGWTAFAPWLSEGQILFILTRSDSLLMLEEECENKHQPLLSHVTRNRQTAKV